MTANGTPSAAPLPLRWLLWNESASLLRLLTGALWITGWYQVVLNRQAAWLTAFLAVLLVTLISYLLTRVTSRVEMDLSRARITALVWTGLALAVTTAWLRPSAILLPGGDTGQVIDSSLSLFVHLVIILVAIFRGFRTAAHPADSGSVLGDFQAGVAAYLLLAFGFPALPPQEIIGSFIPFLLASLIALSLARVSDISLQRGGRLPPSLREWAGPILIAVIGLAAVSLGAAWLVSREIGILAVGLSVLGLVLIFAVGFILSLPILLILNWLLPWLENVLGAGFELTPLQNPAETIDETLLQGLEGTAAEAAGMDSAVLPVLGLVLLALIALTVFSLRRRTLPWRLAGAQEEQLADARGAGPASPYADSPLRRRFGRGRQLLAAARIRRIYAELETLSARLGHPRKAAETPLEFERTLRLAFPEQAAGLALITGAYLRVRYGELPEDREELEQINRAWEEIRRSGKARLRQVKKTAPSARG